MATRLRTQTAYLQKDIDECAGEPDGELVFIDMIGFEVPSYVDPRYDLIAPGQVRGQDRLSHHVPFNFRGPFQPRDLPDPDFFMGETNAEGNAVCTGKRKDGMPCRAEAMNRSPFCGNHGGQLHPADKKITQIHKDVTVDPIKVRKMDRAQKVINGLIKVSDLSDSEILGMYVINDDGRQIRARSLTTKIHQEISKEMLSRMNDFLFESLPGLLKAMVEIALDPMVEPGDRVKAIQWAAERSIGKTPEVILHGSADKPYEQILTKIEGGSREDYRRAIESGNIIEGEVVELGDAGSEQNGGSADPVHEDIRRMGKAVDQSGAGRVPGRTSDSDSGIDERFVSQSLGDAGHDPTPVLRDGSESDPASSSARKRAARAAIQKLKNKRYAARAQGYTQIEQIGWLLEFIARKDGTHTMKVWSAEDQTPAVVDRIMAARAIEDGAIEMSGED